MPVVEVPGDLDETIRQSTDEELWGEEITEEMREVMARIVDPDVETYELTFHERKVALQYGWVP